MSEKSFKALHVTENPDGTFKREITTRNINDLPGNNVLIDVKYSSLNYKDALSASGNKGVTRKYPHTPGIDAAGIVRECMVEPFKPGNEVIVTGYDLGMNTPGGFGQNIRVPGEWVVPKPDSLSLRESMIIGTAGYTAAQALFKMQAFGQKPEDGKILVTGASGGVGCMAIAILHKAGYEVIASTGKTDKSNYLKNLGANEIVDRSFSNDDSGKALLKPRWAGAIDNVGGNTLVTALKACKKEGNVASIGNVGSPAFTSTVFPFILNGVNLIGIESANFPMHIRKKIWEKLSLEWKPDNLDSMHTIIAPDELNKYIDLMLKGQTFGRIVVEH